MAREFELDTSRLERLISLAPQTATRGAKRGLHDALDDWVVQSRNIAPLDKRTLRDGIKAEGVRSQTNNLTAEISSTAMERDFNYAYYIHERDAGGKNLRTPGTVKKYLDESADQNKDKWLQWVEDEIRDELRSGGW
jgi:hypothetical protein